MIIKLKRIFKTKKNLTINHDLPDVTIVIAAYNEELFIENKITNTFNLNYPKDKLNVLVVADGSSDETIDIIKQYPKVTLLYEKLRQGKTAAINRAMEFVKTPITIFTDANTALNTDAVMNIVKHFNNIEIGCVAGEKRISVSEFDKASSAGEGIYWKYESKLKQWDYELYSTAGAAGELFAIRTQLYTPISEDTILDDFMISLKIVEKGYRIAYEPNAYAIEHSSLNTHEELKRKTRICAGGFQAITRLTSLLNFMKFPWFTFQYISHRVLRWTLAPLALILLIPIHLIVLKSNDPIITTMFYAHTSFYLLVLIGWILEEKRIRMKMFFIPYYFYLMNYSVIIGFKKFISNKQEHIWQRAERATI
jgi:cellulose synthase/poly-beta-1,6-N-acetylglucosamine synthase-like glycosyltransferase